MTASTTTYRGCPPWDTCPPQQQCCHLLCYDPDWLEDMEEQSLNRKANDTLWDAFHYPAYRASIPPTQLAEYECKFGRCQRIMDKREEIEAEIFYRQTKLLLKWGSNEEELADSHAEIQALEKKVGKRFAWYERDTEVSGS
jgi:hypothetical protein